MSAAVFPAPPTVHPWTAECTGTPMQSAAQNILPSTASSTWPSINMALFYPFMLSSPATVYRLAWMVGGVQNGNIDLGIYDKNGNRLVSTGSTAMGAINTLQVITTNLPFTLAGGEYYLAAACDSGSGTLQRIAAGVPSCRISGILQMASAMPLPATATFAAASSAIVAGIAAFLHNDV